MINIFLDESYDRTAKGNRFIVAATAVFENNWTIFHGRTEQARKQPRSKWLGAINDLLESAKGLSRVSYADIPFELLPSGERDSYADVKGISRTDNVWSWCIAYTVAIAMARLLRHEAKFDEARVYYHRKDLKADHRGSLEKTVIEVISRLIVECQKDLGYKNVPKITAFKQVSDAERNSSASANQNGIWVSDHLCWAFRKSGVAMGQRRIEVGDISEAVLETFGRMHQLEAR